MSAVARRLVIHFPGYEPLNAERHRQRYERAANISGATWAARFETSSLVEGEEGPSFDVRGRGKDWTCDSHIIVHDHAAFIAEMAAEGLISQLYRGFKAATLVMLQGGLTGYFRHAWRFGCFYVFPFAYMKVALILSLLIAVWPLLIHHSAFHLLWSVPLGYGFFRYGALPFSARYHVMHLFSDWRFAVDMASLPADKQAWIELLATRVERALRDHPSDEVLITSHSMGSSVASHVIGRVLERDPQAFAGRRATFATLGGAILQCALLSPAKLLRDRIGRIARCPDLTFFEVQCLTDIVHLYKARSVAASGHPDAPQPKLVFLRFRTVLTPAHYRKNKWDVLRMHRQYVLGSDKRGNFDFALLTAGPVPASDFAEFTMVNLPPISDDGRYVEKA